MQELQTVKVRARGTSLVLQLEDSKGMREPKIFTIGDRTVTSIPVDFAHSLYLNGAALAWIREGKLIILEGEKYLNDYAVKNSYIDEAIEVVDEKRIINIITGSNLTKIKEIFESENAELAFDLASQNAAQLSQGTIQIIEETTGISLSVD